MKQYRINLSKIILGTETLWSGSVIEIKESTKVSFDEFICRNSKELAKKDIIQKLEKINFDEDKVIFTLTSETITSMQDLEAKLLMVSD